MFKGRRIILFSSFLLLALGIRAQQVDLMGVDLSFGSANAISATLYYQHATHQFHLGGSMQFSDKRGKPLDDPSGHGATLEGSGDYFWSVDAGYGHIFLEHFPVNIVVSAGRKISYTNYLDSGFTDGGFHTVDGIDLTVGIGADAGYNFRGFFEVFAGFHTLRKFYLGVRVPIPDF